MRFKNIGMASEKLCRNTLNLKPRKGTPFVRSLSWKSNMWSIPRDEKRRKLRADVSKYRPGVYKSEKSKILKTIHKVALGKLLT